MRALKDILRDYELALKGEATFRHVREFIEKKMQEILPHGLSAEAQTKSPYTFQETEPKLQPLREELKKNTELWKEAEKVRHESRKELEAFLLEGGLHEPDGP